MESAKALEQFRHWHYRLDDPVEKLPIPNRLRRRPRNKGVPVPYAQRHGGEFHQLCSTVRQFAIANNRCGMCGVELVGMVGFLGSELDVANSEFSEPACHPECAYYRATVLRASVVDMQYDAIVIARKQYARSIGTVQSGMIVLAVAKRVLAIDFEVFRRRG